MFKQGAKSSQDSKRCLKYYPSDLLSNVETSPRPSFPSLCLSGYFKQQEGNTNDAQTPEKYVTRAEGKQTEGCLRDNRDESEKQSPSCSPAAGISGVLDDRSLTGNGGSADVRLSQGS